MHKHKQFKYNWKYIVENMLDDETIAAAGVELLDETEIFVKHPDFNDYYGSQWGRVISIKSNDKPRMLAATIGGRADKQYLYYTFCRKKGYPNKKSLSAQRVCADIFCPNFWKANTKLEAHHIDGNTMNNYYKNLVLLPPALHRKLETIQEFALVVNGKLTKYKNVLDLVYDTGLTLEQIIEAPDKRKPTKRKTQGYIFYRVKTREIGYKLE